MMFGYRSNFDSRRTHVLYPTVFHRGNQGIYQMSLSKREFSAAWPLAINRFNLAKDAPEDYWEDDFFASLPKKVPWEKILTEAQESLPSADAKEINEVFLHVLWREFERAFDDESQRTSFRDEAVINILKFIPLDDQESEQVEKAKTLLLCPGADSSIEGFQYEIDDLSGTECGDPDKSRTLLPLEAYVKGKWTNRDYITKGSLAAEDISLIRSAISNGRLEAAWNLVVARWHYSNHSKLRNYGTNYWVRQVLEMLKTRPSAVEKESLRLKTRLFLKQNCEKLFPFCLKFFSSCVLLSITQKERINKIENRGNSYRYYLERDLKLLHDALRISELTIIKTGYVLWLKKEYYNRIHEADTRKLDAWIMDNKKAVSLAVAERLIQTHSDLKKLIQDVHKVLEEEILPVGDVEKRLFEDARKCVNEANSEVDKDGVILKKINRDPAPAA